jgi:hypothetical protein
VLRNQGASSVKLPGPLLDGHGPVGSDGRCRLNIGHWRHARASQGVGHSVLLSVEHFVHGALRDDAVEEQTDRSPQFSVCFEQMFSTQAGTV